MMFFSNRKGYFCTLMITAIIALRSQALAGCNAVNSPEYQKGQWGTGAVGTQVSVPSNIKDKINSALSKIPKLDLELKEVNATFKTGQRTCTYGSVTSLDTYNEAVLTLKTTTAKIPIYGIIFSKAVTVPTIFGDVNLHMSGGAGVTFNTSLSLAAKGGKTTAGCSDCEWIYGSASGSVTAALEAYAGLNAGYEKRSGEIKDIVDIGGSVLEGGLVFEASLQFNERSEPSGFSGSAKVTSVYAETQFNLFWLDPEVHVDFYPSLGGSVTCGDYEFSFSSGEVSLEEEV